MIGCKTRGFSFTRALLGLSADELHLCGDAAAVPLVQKLLKVTGDDIQVLKLLQVSARKQCEILLWSIYVLFVCANLNMLQQY